MEISTRDYFAGLAMQQALRDEYNNPNSPSGFASTESMAEAAYFVADAMMKAKRQDEEKRNTKGKSGKRLVCNCLNGGRVLHMPTSACNTLCIQEIDD